MTTKRTKAVKVAQALIDEGGIDKTYSDLQWMHDNDLFKLLGDCGYYWNGRDWVED